MQKKKIKIIFVHPDVDVGRGDTFNNSCPVNTANKCMWESWNETIQLFLRLYNFYIAKRSKNAVSEISANSGFHGYPTMMTSKICTQRKKSSGKFSLPNCLPYPEPASGKAARGSVQGEHPGVKLIPGKFRSHPKQKKNIFVWMNRWIISIWDWSTHGLPTNEKERGRFVGLFLLCWDCQGFIALLALYSIYPGCSLCLE